MDANVFNRPTVRPLYDWEIHEAREVFGDGLRYEEVRIHENNPFPNAIDRLGRRLKGMAVVEASNNAVTLGNHCYFPVRLLDKLVDPTDPDYYKIPWLIHELTHVWQYQRLGWSYLAQALTAQFREKAAAYDFGSDTGLQKRRKDGWTLRKFNLEQQGDIARGYYERKRLGQDVSNWQPFIDELRKNA